MSNDSRPGLRDSELLGQQNHANLMRLRHHWDSAYDIHVRFPDHWSAARLDSTGTPLAARSAAELRQLIIDDYSARPVPRRPSLRGEDDD